MPLAPGTHLGPYEIVAAIGAGGMGEVYRARDTRLARDVAVKVLPAAFASDRHRVARFEREAKAVAALSHPNILAIHDTGTDAGQMFVVTELLEGETLRARVTGPIPLRKAIDVAIQIARGLAAAHDKGIVHRDLKPENVFLTKDGQVKILDFGLARQSSTNTGVTETASAMTGPGTVMGTPAYMAPEQVRGQATDARTDLFALGSVLYEMLSGRRAFQRDTSADTMFAIVKEDPPDLATVRPELPSGLSRIVRHCLEKNLTERFQSARDVAFALEALSGSEPALRAGDSAPALPISRRIWPVTLAAAGVALAVIAFLAGRASGSRVTPGSNAALSSVQFERKTFDPQTVFNARFLHDSKTVVFSTSREGRTPELFVLRPDALIPESIGKGMHLLSISSTDQLLVQTDASVIAMDRASGHAARLEDLYSAPRPWGGDNVRAADWGPKGDSIAVVRDVDGVDQLEYPEGTVLYTTTGFISHVRVSPDESRVAFFDHRVRFDDRGSLKSVDRAKHVTTLASGDGGSEFPGQTGLAWTPDGSTVLFTVFSVATEEPPVRAVRVSAPGVSRVVVKGPGTLALHDVAPDGSWLVDRVNYRNGIMALTPGQQAERDLTYAGNTWFGFLSPQDPRQFLFTEWTGTAGVDYGVATRNVDETRVKHLGPGNVTGFSPDGKWALAYLSSNLEVRAYSTTTSDFVTLKTAFENLSATGFSWYPDSRAALVCGSEKGRPPSCYRVALDGTAAAAVTTDGVVDGLVISEDRVLGRRTDDSFEVYPSSPRGGPPHKAEGLTNKDMLIGWDTKDRRVYAGPPANPLQIDSVDIQTGQRRTFKTLTPPNRAGVLSIEYPVTLVNNGEFYSYRYSQVLSSLYVVRGGAPLVGIK